MVFWRRLVCKFRNFLRPSEADTELEKEIASHLAMLQDDFLQEGMSVDDAFWAARRAYGGVEQVKESHREERSWLWLEQLRQDIRFSARALLKDRGFSITAILTLALGIGANTAIFSLINSMMLRALPVTHPEQLLQVTMSGEDFMSNPVWEQLRDRQNVFSGIFAYGNWRLNLSAGGEARHAQGSFVSGQFFDTLGLRAMPGRTFTTADDRRECSAITVLSYGFWQREYAGRPDALGKIISLDNHPFQIIGVLKPGFTGVDIGSNKDLFVPLCTERIMHGENSSLDNRGSVWVRVIGRSRPGISASQVQARLKTLAPLVFHSTVPPNWNVEERDAYLKNTFDTQMATNGLSFVRKEYRKALLVLMVMVGLVLLIACANVGNLLLARNAARQREIAIRMALGSARSRLMRQLLTESLLLSLIGAMLAIPFAHWGAQLLAGLLSSEVYNDSTVFLDLSIDSQMLAFTCAVAFFTAVLFGLAPAWRATRADPQAAMKANARGVIEGGHFGLGRILVVLQMAVSLAVVIGAGLMLSTLFRLETLDPGFERSKVLLVSVDLSNGHYSSPQRAAVLEEMLDRLRLLPGVRSASASDSTPVDGSLEAWNLQIEGYTPKGKEDTEVFANKVTDRFFETLGTELLAGRDFSSQDTPHSPEVAIVNRTFVKKFLAGRNPVGKQYHRKQSDKLGSSVEIIGVVGDAKYIDLREHVHPTAYIAASQSEDISPSTTFELRAAPGTPNALIPAVRSCITKVNQTASVEFQTLAVQVERSLARERLLATLSAFFGGLALILAMIGLYGVVSYNVALRRHEIGIRMALGALQSTVLRVILSEVAVLVGVGLAIGASATILATRFVTSFLYGVKPNDPWTFFLAASMLTAVAALAGFWPALRASRLDPSNVLREE